MQERHSKNSFLSCEYFCVKRQKVYRINAFSGQTRNSYLVNFGSLNVGTCKSDKAHICAYRRKKAKKGEKPGCGTGLFPNWGVAWGGGINTRSRGCGTSPLSTPILYGINMNKLWTICKKMIINQDFLDFCKKEIFFDDEQTNVCNFRTFVLWYRKQPYPPIIRNCFILFFKGWLYAVD